jgi:protein TonB
LSGPHVEYAEHEQSLLTRKKEEVLTMYGGNQRQGKGTQAFGAVAAVALTFGMGGLFTAMNFNAERMERISSELVFIDPPAPPMVEEIEPLPVVEAVEDTPAPPTPTPLLAPEIAFVPEEIPVIAAPVIEAPPAAEPAPGIAAHAPVHSRSAPRLIASDKPAYPTASQRAGEQGVTQLDVCVASNGRVTSVSVARSSGHTRLDEAAAKWIRGERFTPAKINGAARDVCGHTVVYEWNLRDA